MNSFWYLFFAMACVGLITLLTRALPFLVFGNRGQLPGWVSYLGGVLPCAIMAILVIYCLKDAAGANGICQLVCAGVVAILWWAKKNMALSIFVGTISYMVLIRLVG